MPALPCISDQHKAFPIRARLGAANLVPTSYARLLSLTELWCRNFRRPSLLDDKVHGLVPDP